MLPAALHNALPGVIRRAAVRVTVCRPDPRLSPGHVWPAAERPHTIALAFERSRTDGLAVGCHRLRGGVRT